MYSADQILRAYESNPNELYLLGKYDYTEVPADVAPHWLEAQGLADELEDKFDFIYSILEESADSE